jgi:hypothetical protein
MRFHDFMGKSVHGPLQCSTGVHGKFTFERQRRRQGEGIRCDPRGQSRLQCNLLSASLLCIKCYGILYDARRIPFRMF